MLKLFEGQKDLINYGVEVAKELGGVNKAILLSQIIYWIFKDNGKFYKTDIQWSEELGLSEYEVNTAKKDLEKLGLIVIDYKRLEHRTRYYINIEIYNKFVCKLYNFDYDIKKYIKFGIGYEKNVNEIILKIKEKEKQKMAKRKNDFPEPKKNKSGRIKKQVDYNTETFSETFSEKEKENINILSNIYIKEKEDINNFFVDKKKEEKKVELLEEEKKVELLEEEKKVELSEVKETNCNKEKEDIQKRRVNKDLSKLKGDERVYEYIEQKREEGFSKSTKGIIYQTLIAFKRLGRTAPADETFEKFDEWIRKVTTTIPLSERTAFQNSYELRIYNFVSYWEGMSEETNTNADWKGRLARNIKNMEI